METLSEQLLIGTVLESGDERLNATDIRRLYESANYPLVRKEQDAPAPGPKDLSER